MPRMPRAPLVNLNIELLPRRNLLSPPLSPTERRTKPWTAYIPLAFAVFLMLAPQPSFIFVVIHHHWLSQESPYTAVRHITISTILILFAFTSLVVCCTRDPGRPKVGDVPDDPLDGEGEALIGRKGNEEDDDFNSSKKWCRTCWAPKFERTHHCSTCGRCVLKMDHHCPWLANNCVGHRTYPAFLHFLSSITLLAFYMGLVGANTLYFYFTAPIAMDDPTPIHALVISLMGMILGMLLSSFLGYHLYLCITNQTTLETLSAYLLLGYIPRSKPEQQTSGTSISQAEPSRIHRVTADRDSPYHFPSPPPSPQASTLQVQVPWEEHTLTWEQRRAVRYAHRRIRLYDQGWKNNLKQTLGLSGALRASKRRYPQGGAWIGWLELVTYGGRARGDGKTFPRNPDSDRMLSRLGDELEKIQRRTSGQPNDRINTLDSEDDS